MCISALQHEFCPWVWEKCRRFSSFGAQLGVLGLDAVFLAGKVSKAVPAGITKAALTALSGIGFTALPFTADLFRKTIEDALCGSRSENASVMIIATFKAIEIASNFGLLTGGFAASLFGLFGNLDAQSALYAFMIPWGEGTLILSLALMAAYIFMTKRAAPLLSVDLLDDLKRCEHLPSAAHVRLCMDKDTLQHLNGRLEEIPEEEREDLLHVIESNLETQLKYAQGAQLGLTLFGYALLAIEKYFTPNSVQSAFINFGVACAYTIKMFIELFREVRQRHQISEIANQSGAIEQLPPLSQRDDRDDLDFPSGQTAI